MTTRFKDFGSGGEASAEPLQFALHGETFSCRPAIQGKFLLSLVAGTDEDDPGAAAETVTRFFKYVIVSEDYERFEALLDDPDRIVSVETLGEITGWLVEQYATRPTTQPDPSPAGD